MKPVLKLMRLGVLCWLLAFTLSVAAQEQAHQIAPVEVDGEVLFRVRGIEALPATVRAERIAQNIQTLASDPSFSIDALQSQDRGIVTDIVGGHVVVMSLVDEDGRLEGVERSILVPVYVMRIRQAITEYREARTRSRLIAGSGRALAAIAISALCVLLLFWLLRRAETRLKAIFDRHVSTLATQTHRLRRVARLWKTIHSALGVVRIVSVLLIALFLLEYVLRQFPWTRGAGIGLFQAISTPLVSMGHSFLANIPNLVLLVILFFLVRYGLSVASLYFDALKDGSIRLQNFEPEWAQPTYNIVRVLTIAFALVIAYPLIPGSESPAFKGLSILAGVMLSLSSTSALSNVIAGYMIIFRRAFGVGDRVQIGDEIRGVVTQMRMQVTHIRTVKNEEITIPNSEILNSAVVNYSKPAREGKLIMHSEVNIGYGVPWRQVEALLLEAANRTPNLLKEPPPYVIQLKLGEFAVTYQINGFTDRADMMQWIYTDLHRNILDQFNEHGVQIMTPAYEGDPESPKIVAKDQWFAAPAPSGE